MHAQKLAQTITATLHKMHIEHDQVIVTTPTDIEHGDYTTQIALKLAKSQGKNPIVLAQSIADALPVIPEVESVRVLPPGFINFTLNKSFLLTELKKAIDTTSTEYQDKTVMVEYTDPNPFKEFHIGHLYSNSVGESISRLHEASGAVVRRACYQGDVGIHVASSVWGMLNNEIPFDTAQSYDLAGKVKWLGQCYAQGATKYKEDEVVKQEIQNLNAQIFVAAQEMWKKREQHTPIVDYAKLVKKEYTDQSKVSAYYEAGRDWTLAYFETVYARLGTKFDDYYFESYVGEYGYEIVMKFLEQGAFVRSEGAIVFPGDHYGLHTRVLINSLGLPTYEAKEIGLNTIKYNTYKPDLSFIVTANEINEYFKVMLKALSLVAPAVAERTRHIGHGIVKLPEGKMASRTGNILRGEWLLDEAKSRLLPILEKSEKVDKSKIDETAERLAVASVKYSLLKSNIGKDTTFSFDESLAFEGNSGPYLLYTVVRASNILAQAKPEKYDDVQIELLPEEMILLRLLQQYNEVIHQATLHIAPHLVCTYLYTLAQAFNAYYAKVPVLKSEGATRSMRLTLVAKVQTTLTHGLQALGIQTVEKM